MSTITDTIDQAIADYGVSPDAMRCNATTPPLWRVHDGHIHFHGGTGRAIDYDRLAQYMIYRYLTPETIRADLRAMNT